MSTVPVLLLAAAAAMWRAFSRSSVELALVGFLATYCAFYAVYCYVRGGFVVDQFYYFGHLTIAIYFAIPLVVGLLTRIAGSVIPVTAGFALGLLLPHAGAPAGNSSDGCVFAVHGHRRTCQRLYGVLGAVAGSSSSS